MCNKNEPLYVMLYRREDSCDWEVASVREDIEAIISDRDWAKESLPGSDIRIIESKIIRSWKNE